MECEIAQVNSNKKEIKKIFKETKTIVIFGLSPNETKASNIVAKYLMNVGYKIIPIYPKEETILGQKVYRNLKDINEQIDMIDIFRKSNMIEAIVDDAIAIGKVKTIWTQLGIVNNKAAKKAKDNGINVVQNLCTKIEHINLI